MNYLFCVLLTAAFFAVVKGTCQVQSSTECETSYHHLHCAASGWHVACMSNQHCLCLHSRSCTTATDCGRLEVTGPGGVITYGCPGNGEWGCHHTTSYSHGNCGCLHRETK